METSRNALLKSAIGTVAVLAVIALGLPFSQGAFSADLAPAFPDIPREDKFYNPHIQNLKNQLFMRGYENGLFGWNDKINRSQIVKVVGLVRQAEVTKMKEPVDRMLQEIKAPFEKYFECAFVGCSKMEGGAFTDVAPRPNACVSLSTKECEPFYIEYVYYAVANGYVKGFQSKSDPNSWSFDLKGNVVRIHALKMLMAEGGDVPLANDKRYQVLLKTADGMPESRCLEKGAWDEIRNRADPGNPDSLDAQKLLAYAKLADRLGIFGGASDQCAGFGPVIDQKARGDFLSDPLLRQEAARYAAFTTSYGPIRAMYDGKEPAVNPPVAPTFPKPEEPPVTEKPKIQPVEDPAKKPVVPDQKAPTCEPGNYGYSIVNQWPTGTVSPGKNEIALRVKPNNPKAWRNVSCAVPKFIHLDKNGKATAATAEFAEGAGNSEGTWRASFPWVEKLDKSAPCEEQSYAVVLNGATIGSTVKWKVGECAEPRIFKTSIANVNVRAGTKTDSFSMRTIKDAKTEITVIDKAVQGDYVDAYKTDQWYPVKCDGCVDADGKRVSSGFILTSLLHAKQLGNSELGFVSIDDNFSHDGFSRGNSKITGIVLHATLGNGSAVGDRNAIPTSGDANGVGAQYYVDQEGNIAQATPDYKKMHHVGYTGSWKNIKGDRSNFTIGIEIANYGPIKVDSATPPKNAYGSIVNVNTTNVQTLYEKIWKIWNYFSIGDPKQVQAEKKVPQGNVAWSAFGEENNEKIQNWQSYKEKQLKSVDLLIEYLEERYGLPKNNYFEYNNPNSYTGLTESEIKKYSYYYYPKNSDERVKYNEAVENWKGIFQHHNMTGKFDNGPGLNIDELIRIRNEF